MDQPETLDTSKSVQAAHILHTSVVLLLRTGRLGTQRAVNIRALKIEKDGKQLDDQARDQMTAARKLFDKKKAKELNACGHVLDMARAYLRSMSGSSHRVFGPGTYLVPKTSLAEVEARLGLFLIDLGVAVAALKLKWAAIVAQRQQDMGPLFNQGDYLTVDEMAAEFELDWNYISYAPDALEEVDRAVYDRAVAKHEARMAAAYEDVVGDLYAGALQCCEELAERLTPGVTAAGAKKSIRDTALRDLNDYIEKLPSRATLVGQQETARLTAAMARVKALSEGLSVDALKKADGVREMLRSEAAKAAETLRGMVHEVERGISFGGLT